MTSHRDLGTFHSTNTSSRLDLEAFEDGCPAFRVDETTVLVLGASLWNGLAAIELRTDSPPLPEFAAHGSASADRTQMVQQLPAGDYRAVSFTDTARALRHPDPEGRSYFSDYEIATHEDAEWPAPEGQVWWETSLGHWLEPAQRFSGGPNGELLIPINTSPAASLLPADPEREPVDLVCVSRLLVSDEIQGPHEVMAHVMLHGAEHLTATSDVRVLSFIDTTSAPPGAIERWLELSSWR